MALLVASAHGRVAAMCTLLDCGARVDTCNTVRPDQICQNSLQAF